MVWYRNACTALLAFLAAVLMLAGCSRDETAGAVETAPIEITARFTDPIDIEPQPSDKCIACHTKVNPITKLASEAVDSGHGGGGG